MGFSLFFLDRSLCFCGLRELFFPCWLAHTFWRQLLSVSLAVPCVSLSGLASPQEFGVRKPVMPLVNFFELCCPTSCLWSVAALYLEEALWPHGWSRLELLTQPEALVYSLGALTEDLLEIFGRWIQSHSVPGVSQNINLSSQPVKILAGFSSSATMFHSPSPLLWQWDKQLGISSVLWRACVFLEFSSFGKKKDAVGSPAYFVS